MIRSKMLCCTAQAPAAGLCTAAWAAGPGKDRRCGEWVQWSFGRPMVVYPIADTTGQHCKVGQHGTTWRLAPNFGGDASRSCTVPQRAKLQFSVAGASFVYTPGCCGDESPMKTDYGRRLARRLVNPSPTSASADNASEPGSGTLPTPGAVPKLLASSWMRMKSTTPAKASP